MRSKTCQFQYIVKHRKTELLLLFSIITPWSRKFFFTVYHKSIKTNSKRVKQPQFLIITTEVFSFKNIKIETMSDITMILEQDKLWHYYSIGWWFDNFWKTSFLLFFSELLNNCGCVISNWWTKFCWWVRTMTYFSKKEI